MTDEELIAQDIEEGYFFGIMPDWKVFIADPVFYEDIADLVRQGFKEGTLPCKWKLEIIENKK